MAENLNYNIGWGGCYRNDSSNCAKYGRLYNWSQAMKACPAGWHLPNRVEWDNLSQTVGGLREPNNDWANAGAKLKSTTGWNNGGNGDNSFGFSALPGGYNFHSYADVGNFGCWWSTTEGGTYDARYWGMDYNNSTVVSEAWSRKSDEKSVRCVMD